jgi:predicted nuclease of restriction endonuclease-like RecB superfamily
MMKLESTNRQDWQGFSRILEVMSFVGEIGTFGPEETREVMEKLCQLPPSAGQTMSMEEVVFWAGVAVGMQVSQHAEQGMVDAETEEKVLVFSSVFEHSTKNAIVDLALGEMEAPNPTTYQNTGSR